MSTYQYLPSIQPKNQVLKRECGGRELSNNSNTPQRTMYRNAQRDMKNICDDAKATTCEAIKGDPKLTQEEQFQRIEETQRKLAECVRRRKEISTKCFIPPNKINGFKEADPHGYNEMVNEKKGHDGQMSVVVTRRSDCKKLEKDMIDKQNTKANTTSRRKTQSNTDSQHHSEMSEQYQEQIGEIQTDIDELRDVDERAAEQIPLEERVSSIQSRINKLPKIYQYKLNANLSRKNRQLTRHHNTGSNIVFQHQNTSNMKSSQKTKKAQTTAKNSQHKSRKKGKGARRRSKARRSKARRSKARRSRRLNRIYKN